MKGVRTWREFAAACVLAVMALGGASGPALAEVVARPSGQAGALTLHGPVLFYGDRAGNRSVVHRRELATGADRIVYRAPPGMLVTRLEAGGGTLGVGLQGSGAREDALTRVVALSAAGGSARNLAAGRYAEFRRRRCGTVAELFDVGPDGTVVFQNVRRNRPCGGRVGGDVFTASLRSPRARVALRGRSSQRGGALRDAFLGARVGGGGLLAYAPFVVRVARSSVARSLPVPGTGTVRSADHDGAGRAVVSRDGTGGRTSAISVFASLAGPPTATFAGADGASEVLLCGERVVEVAPFPDSPDVPRVVVRALDGSGARAPALSTGPEASPRAQACTADRLVIALTDDDGERSTIEVVQLEP